MVANPGFSPDFFVYYGMKYTDKFFKFPVKLYLTKDLEQRDLLGKSDDEDEPEYVLGWESVDISDICGYGTIFSKGRTISEVKEDGFDSTVVYLKYGKEVGCSWSPEKFESRLNLFYEKLTNREKPE